MSRLMTKPTKWPVRPAKTQISLGIRPVWSESSLSAWRSSGSSATHRTASDGSDQAGRMPSLISLHWVHMSFCWFCHGAAQTGFSIQHYFSHNDMIEGDYKGGQSMNCCLQDLLIWTESWLQWYLNLQLHSSSSDGLNTWPHSHLSWYKIGHLIALNWNFIIYMYEVLSLFVYRHEVILYWQNISMPYANNKGADQPDGQSDHRFCYSLPICDRLWHFEPCGGVTSSTRNMKWKWHH